MEPVPVPSHACFSNDNQQNPDRIIKVVGVRLEEPTFTQGQLYVAASRVGDHQHIQLAVNKSVSRKTRNVIHREIL